jgi:hypothetical protein
MRTKTFTLAVLCFAACRSEKSAEQPASQAVASAETTTVSAAKIQVGALTQLPWLLGTFRGAGIEGTTQAPFYERYSLADDSTLIVESFKDSTLAGAIDSTRFEVRNDSLTSRGERRYVATSISPDSINFGPLAGVKNGFLWKKGDSLAWTAVIVPLGGDASKQRYYRMARIR